MIGPRPWLALFEASKLSRVGSNSQANLSYVWGLIKMIYKMIGHDLMERKQKQNNLKTKGKQKMKFWRLGRYTGRLHARVRNRMWGQEGTGDYTANIHARVGGPCMTLYVGSTLPCTRTVCRRGERSEAYTVGVHARVLWLCVWEGKAWNTRLSTRPCTWLCFLGEGIRRAHGLSTCPYTQAVPRMKREKDGNCFITWFVSTSKLT